jgi:hypothetical protein
MKVFGLAGAMALAAVLAMAGACPAATIQEVQALQFNPSQYDFYASGYGQLGYFLTWNNVSDYNQFLTGEPARAIAHTSPANPAWLDFHTVSTGATGKTGIANPLTTPTQSLYQLGSKNGQAWSMNFSILFYDPGFNGTDMTVQLEGSIAGTSTANFASHVVSKADVNGGMMVKYRIDAVANELVNVAVTSNGDESYAAGFFMDSVSGAGTAADTSTDTANLGALPEPATLCLLGLGAAGLAARRRRRT